MGSDDLLAIAKDAESGDDLYRAGSKQVTGVDFPEPTKKKEKTPKDPIVGVDPTRERITAGTEDTTLRQKKPKRMAATMGTVGDILRGKAVPACRVMTRWMP